MRQSNGPDSSPAWVTRSGYTLTVDNRNVFDCAIERLHDLYDYDLPVVVSFSGGKDSTCALMTSG